MLIYNRNILRIVWLIICLNCFIACYSEEKKLNLKVLHNMLFPPTLQLLNYFLAIFNFRINSKKLQLLYIDRPHTPLETAIFWSEYVIRHKNESKELLKSSKIHLNYFQTYLIDVFVALILPLIIAICIISWTIAHIRKNWLFNMIFLLIFIQYFVQNNK